MRNIFTRACSYAIVCVLHAGLAALTRGTILNHTHVSCVEHAQGVNITRELYCINYVIAVVIMVICLEILPEINLYVHHGHVVKLLLPIALYFIKRLRPFYFQLFLEG